MVAHQNRFGKDSENIKAWKAALSEAAGLKGHHIHTGFEIDHIKEIVEKVLAKIAPKPLLVVQKIYEMTQLNDQHSLELFCRNAFGKSHPKTGYEAIYVFSCSWLCERLLDWELYPSKSFSPKFYPRNIIILNLPYSQLTTEEPLMVWLARNLFLHHSNLPHYGVVEELRCNMAILRRLCMQVQLVDFVVVVEFHVHFLEDVLLVGD
ncbi:hypothetical protein P8452_49330 [Trifolium repens]|nr:hypothetical protein P8452_49330 [Trifolium repens]